MLLNRVVVVGGKKVGVWNDVQIKRGGDDLKLKLTSSF